MAGMNTRIERTLTGTFRTAHLAADVWQLTTSAAGSNGAAGSVEIYLSGVEPEASAVLDGATPTAVCVAWSGAAATVTLVSPGASTQFRSRTATIHESRPQLYRGLPLVVLDDAARGFWRRVFLIARIPGGRRLLRWIAQRKGAG